MSSCMKRDDYHWFTCGFAANFCQNYCSNHNTGTTCISSSCTSDAKKNYCTDDGTDRWCTGLIEGSRCESVLDCPTQEECKINDCNKGGSLYRHECRANKFLLNPIGTILLPSDYGTSVTSRYDYYQYLYTYIEEEKCNLADFTTTCETYFDDADCAQLTNRAFQGSYRYAVMDTYGHFRLNPDITSMTPDLITRCTIKSDYAYFNICSDKWNYMKSGCPSTQLADNSTVIPHKTFFYLEEAKNEISESWETTENIVVTPNSECEDVECHVIEYGATCDFRASSIPTMQCAYDKATGVTTIETTDVLPSYRQYKLMWTNLIQFICAASSVAFAFSCTGKLTAGDPAVTGLPFQTSIDTLNTTIELGGAWWFATTIDQTHCQVSHCQILYGANNTLPSMMLNMATGIHTAYVNIETVYNFSVQCHSPYVDETVQTPYWVLEVVNLCTESHNIAISSNQSMHFSMPVHADLTTVNHFSVPVFFTPDCKHEMLGFSVSNTHVKFVNFTQEASHEYTVNLRIGNWRSDIVFSQEFVIMAETTSQLTANLTGTFDQTCVFVPVVNTMLFTSEQTFKTSDSVATYTIAGLSSKFQGCPITSYAIATLTTSFNSSIFGYPSAQCSGQATVCDFIDFNVTKTGSYSFSIMPLGAEVYPGNTPQNVFITISCSDDPAFYSVSFNSSLMPTTYEFLQLMPPTTQIEILGFQSSRYPDCNITQYKLVSSPTQTDDEGVAGLSFSSNCSQPCTTIQVDATYYREINFYIKAIVVAGAETISEALFINVTKLNQNDPTLTNFPSSSSLSVMINQKKQVPLGQPVDLDGDTPIVKDFRVSPNTGSAFINMNNNLIAITPNDNSTHPGTYTVSFVLDDLNGRTTEYSLTVSVIPLAIPPYLPPPVAIVEEDEIQKEEKEEEIEPIIEVIVVKKEEATIVAPPPPPPPVVPLPDLLKHTQKIFVPYEIKRISLEAVVTIEFAKRPISQLSKLKSKNPFEFKVEPNLQYREMMQEEGHAAIRDTAIAKAEVLEVSGFEIEVQLTFRNISAISEGGIEYLDKLRVQILEAEGIQFEEMEVENKQTGLVEKVRYEVNPQSVKTASIPQLVDANDTWSQLTTQMSKGIESTMDGALIGSMAVNFFVSVSMKKLLEAVRVLQIISNFAFLEINFPPITKLFVQAIYKFCTFKVMPKGAMDKILIFLGLKESLSGGEEEEAPTSRLLQEVVQPETKGSSFESMGFKSNASMFEQMNAMLMALIGFILVLLFLLFGALLVKRFPKLKAILQKINETLFFNTIHQVIKNTVIPMSISALFSLKSMIELGQPVTQMISPLTTITFFLLYPIVMMRYLVQKKERMLDKEDRQFQVRHQAYYEGIAMSSDNLRNLSYIAVVHYRKLIFTSMIVFASDFSGIQIQVIMMISIAMLLLVSLFQPYTTSASNLQDVKDELIVLTVCYQLILLSDFVPLYHTSFKVAVGYCLILTIVLTILYVIVQIGKQIGSKLLHSIESQKQLRKFVINQNKQVSGLAVKLYKNVSKIQELEKQIKEERRLNVRVERSERKQRRQEIFSLEEDVATLSKEIKVIKEQKFQPELGPGASEDQPSAVNIFNLKKKKLPQIESMHEIDDPVYKELFRDEIREDQKNDALRMMVREDKLRLDTPKFRADEIKIEDQSMSEGSEVIRVPSHREEYKIQVQSQKHLFSHKPMNF